MYVLFSTSFYTDHSRYVVLALAGTFSLVDSQARKGFLSSERFSLWSLASCARKF